MYSLPDHPTIRDLERTGYPDGKEPDYPHCPICDCEADTLYKDRFGNILGCSECVSAVDAWEEADYEE